MKKTLTICLALFLFGAMAMAQHPSDQHHPGQPHPSHQQPGHPQPGYPQGPAYGGPAPARIASPDQVDAIMRCLQEEHFDDRRLAIAKMSVYICPVPVMGLLRMAEIFSFDDKRLEFLEYAYAFCPDRENYWQLCDAFMFSTNADKMCQDLGIRRYYLHER